MDLTGSTTVLVVVAHPDDETFGCGSVLLHAAAHGATTVVCCATRGEAGQSTPGTDMTKPLGEVREAELRAAAEVLGVSRIMLLGYEDSGMTGDCGPESLAGARFEDVRDAVSDCIKDVRPDIVVTLDASDGHRDHARIRDATLAAVDNSGVMVERVYLQCLARSLMRRWQEHMAANAPSSEHVDIIDIGIPDDDITTVIDAARYLPKRLQAMALHASQTSPYEGLPPDLHRDFLATDRLLRVRPPWQGGPPEHDIF